MALKYFSPEAMVALTEYHWPGNAREMRNVIESTLLYAGDPITPCDLPSEIVSLHTREASPPAAKDAAGICIPSAQNEQGFNIFKHERELIISALHQHKRINDVAKALGISRATLYRKLQSLNIEH